MSKPLEWTLEHELSLETYVDRMLNYPSNCPCGCGGQFIPPNKKETIMLRNEHEVTNQEEYRKVQDLFHLDNPSLDSVLSVMEERGTVEVMQIKGTKNEAVVFDCPFRMSSSCEYYRVETSEGDEDVNDIVEMLSTAGAAHIVTEHI